MGYVKNVPHFTDPQEGEFEIPNVQEFTQTQTKVYFPLSVSVWETGHILQTQKRTFKIAKIQKLTQTQTKGYFLRVGLCKKTGPHCTDPKEND